MTRTELRRLIAAHDAAWEGWWPILIHLPPARTRRRLAGGHQSLLAVTAHMVNAEVYWQGRLEELPEEDRDVPLATPMGRLQRIWGELQDRRAAWLAGADPHRSVGFTAIGGPVTASVSECVVHMVTHAHFHRGQLAWICRTMGVAPASRHFIGAFIGEFQTRLGASARRVPRDRRPGPKG